MKKRLPLLLVIAVVVAAAILYLTHFSATDRPKMPEPAKTGPQKPHIEAGVQHGATEKTITPVIAYEYNAKGRRDPFATLIVKMEAEKKKGATPLESYDVSQFKVTGIFWKKSAFYALASSPDGRNYTVREGTPIGLYHGRAVKITRDSVVVTEFLKDYRGNVASKNTVLKLHREDE